MSCSCSNNDLMIRKVDLDSMLEQLEPPWPRIKLVILSSVTCILSTTTHFSFTKKETTTTLNYRAQRNRAKLSTQECHQHIPCFAIRITSRAVVVRTEPPHLHVLVFSSFAVGHVQNFDEVRQLRLHQWRRRFDASTFGK